MLRDGGSLSGLKTAVTVVLLILKITAFLVINTYEDGCVKT